MKTPPAQFNTAGFHASRSCPMIYSTTCSYAIRAMCRLARLSPKGYVSMHDVCAGSGLPSSFVAKIFGELVHAGLLNSAKGRGGGFALAYGPEEITLSDIVAVVDGLEQYKRCVVGLANCDDSQPCAQHERFKPIRAQILHYLGSTTLKQMSEALFDKCERDPPASGIQRNLL